MRASMGTDRCLTCSMQERHAKPIADAAALLLFFSLQMPLNSFGPQTCGRDSRISRMRKVVRLEFYSECPRRRRTEGRHLRRRGHRIASRGSVRCRVAPSAAVCLRNLIVATDESPREGLQLMTSFSGRQSPIAGAARSPSAWQRCSTSCRSSPARSARSGQYACYDQSLLCSATAVKTPRP